MKAKCNIPDCPYVCRSKGIIDVEENSLHEDEDGNMFYTGVCYQCKPAEITDIPYEGVFDEASGIEEDLSSADIKIGNACSAFVVSCNEIEHVIEMRLKQRNGQYAIVPFKILDDHPWNIARQLITAKSYPVILENPRERGNLNLQLMFRKIKNDNRDQFYRYIHTARIGSKAAYELKPFPKSL